MPDYRWWVCQAHPSFGAVLFGLPSGHETISLRRHQVQRGSCNFPLKNCECVPSAWLHASIDGASSNTIAQAQGSLPPGL